jgi:signal peptidase I
VLESGFNPNRITSTIAAEKPGFFGTVWMKALLIVGGCIFSLILAAFASLYVAVRFLGLHAFRTPTNSMCPTICINEFFLANMGAYNAQPPRRGDVIMMKYKEDSALFVKRVVAIGGDVVSPGPNNTVLVNQKPVPKPRVCGNRRLPTSPVQRN